MALNASHLKLVERGICQTNVYQRKVNRVLYLIRLQALFVYNEIATLRAFYARMVEYGYNEIQHTWVVFFAKKKLMKTYIIDSAILEFVPAEFAIDDKEPVTEREHDGVKYAV